MVNEPDALLDAYGEHMSFLTDKFMPGVSISYDSSDAFEKFNRLTVQLAMQYFDGDFDRAWRVNRIAGDLAISNHDRGIISNPRPIT